MSTHILILMSEYVSNNGCKKSIAAFGIQEVWDKMLMIIV